VAARGRKADPTHQDKLQSVMAAEALNRLCRAAAINRLTKIAPEARGTPTRLRPSRSASDRGCGAMA